MHIILFSMLEYHTLTKFSLNFDFCCFCRWWLCCRFCTDVVTVSACVAHSFSQALLDEAFFVQHIQRLSATSSFFSSSFLSLTIFRFLFCIYFRLGNCDGNRACKVLNTIANKMKNHSRTKEIEREKKKLHSSEDYQWNYVKSFWQE